MKNAAVLILISGVVLRLFAQTAMELSFQSGDVQSYGVDNVTRMHFDTTESLFHISQPQGQVSWLTNGIQKITFRSGATVVVPEPQAQRPRQNAGVKIVRHGGGEIEAWLTSAANQRVGVKIYNARGELLSQSGCLGMRSASTSAGRASMRTRPAADGCLIVTVSIGGKTIAMPYAMLNNQRR